jgi:hypothetical protein
VGPASSVLMVHEECPRQGEEVAGSPEWWRLSNAAEAARCGKAERRSWLLGGQRGRRCALIASISGGG